MGRTGKRADLCDHPTDEVYARGLCVVCYYHYKKILGQEMFDIAYPKRHKGGTPKIELYEELLEIGYTKSEVARKYDISVQSVERALQRRRQVQNCGEETKTPPST